MAHQISLKSVGCVFICLAAVLWMPAAVYADGDLDDTFKPGTGASSAVYAMAIQPDGKVLIGGYNKIARLNADGTLDTAFAPSISLYDSVYTDSLVLRPDGNILIGGDFSKVNGISRNGIARLNSDGSLDMSFNPGTGASSDVGSVALQPDGKVLIGGNFYSVNGTSRYGIARLNSDGSLDENFNPGKGVYSLSVNAVALQSDGKILIGGDFTSVNDVSRNRIARLNADGTLDMTFDPGWGANDKVFSIAVQPDGKILIAGEFTGVNAINRGYLARLNADGSLDETFNTESGTDKEIFSVALQSDGKILIGGKFTAFKGKDRKGIARLHPDGTLDTSFDPGSGIVLDYSVPSVYAIALQSDKKFLIGGYFSTFNDTPRKNIARIMEHPLISVIRSFSSSCYPAGVDITVTLTAVPIAGVREYQIEDKPPSNWTVSNISNGGEYDSTAKTIKFGPFPDANSRTLTYDVSFSPTEIRDGSFVGKALTDSVISGIATQNDLYSCVKYHPADSDEDQKLSESEVEAYSEAWKEGRIWETTWAVLPNPIPVEYVSRAAALWKSGEAYKTSLTEGNPPMCWLKKNKRSAVRDSKSSAVRKMSDVCLTGQQFTVTVTVNPGDTVIAYALEENLPPGWWSVSAISDSGEFDAVNNKVKFGPFTDKEQRTLTYQVIPPNISGDFEFKGIASFDGINSKIEGNDTVSAGGNLNTDSKADLADIILALKIAAGFAESGINPNADINGDKKIGIAEAIFILRQLSM